MMTYILVIENDWHCILMHRCLPIVGTVLERLPISWDQDLRDSESALYEYILFRDIFHTNEVNHGSTPAAQIQPILASRSDSSSKKVSCYIAQNNIWCQRSKYGTFWCSAPKASSVSFSLRLVSGTFNQTNTFLYSTS